MKRINQENLAVFVQRLGDPNGQANADGGVNGVSQQNIHGVAPFESKEGEGLNCFQARVSRTVFGQYLSSLALTKSAVRLNFKLEV
jgi:hypothetical protein